MQRTPPFRKVLIANRGEIAIRIARACRELGIPSVALYSEADADALHVRFADEAVTCGPAPAAQSYLAGERIVAIAREVGADAIHPGYGFLSENAAFASRVAEAGLCFIGPAPDTIRAMGSKLESREMMRAAGVPVIPGSRAALGDADVARVAGELGFPLMLKASAGGGGRGMRQVRDLAELEAALPRARSEAERGFGDATVYLEKCLLGARHVEVQILGDENGDLVHLFERECSVQRRHQKLVEECPAPHLSPQQREPLLRAALLAAKTVGYTGVGTVEFLVDRVGRPHFLEMNTRVQVEHPVTECATGFDIVRASILLAARRPLSFQQSEVGLQGAAIECRIYAEDPERNFFPSPGTISRYREPSGPGVRVDSGVDQGSVVSVHYDALLAKLTCYGRNRAETLARMRRALDEFQIEGVKTTLPFHRQVMQYPAFVEGTYDTRLVERIQEPA